MKTARLILIVSFFLAAGCTEKGKPVTTHEQDNRPQESWKATSVDAQSEVRAVTADFKELAARVLSESRIRDLKSYSSRVVHDELLALNEQLLRAPVGERTKILPTLKNYVSLLELECTDIKASCLGLKYFKTAASSAEVVKLAAQMPEFADRSARLVLLAVELKNGLADNNLLRLLIEKVPASNASVRSLLDTGLMQASMNIREEKPLREFLTSIKAWTLLADEGRGLNTGARLALWEMLGRARMMYGEDGKFSAEFLAMQTAMNARAGSFASEQKRILEKKILVPQAMGGFPVTKFDELYFLADAVFMQDSPPQGAAALFANSKRSPKELFEAIDNYSRMRFIMATTEANEIARGIFRAAVPSEQLLLFSMRQSALVRKVWGNLSLRLDLVKSFAAIALKGTPEGAELERQLRQTFNSFGRSVNLSSAFPHTLILFQILSDKKFKISLRGVGEVDTGNLMQVIYYGYTGPLLNYSDENAPLNHFELLHAFDMAVRGNMFAAMGIDPDQFMADVLSRLNQGPEGFINDNLNLTEKRYGESRYMREFESICRELDGGALTPRTLDLDDLKLSPFFGRTMNVMFTGITDLGSSGGVGAGSIRESSMGIFYADMHFAESMERARLDIPQYDRVAAAMLKSYTGYLRKYEGLSEDQIAAKTKKTRTQIARTMDLRAHVLKLASEYYNRFGKCYFKSALKDYEMIRSVIRAEEDHLRSVHRDMKKMRQSADQEEIRRLSERHQFTGMPGGFKGLDRVEKDFYTVSSLDFLMRSGLNIRKISPNIMLNFGSRLDLDNPEVRNAKVIQIPFHESEEVFVQEALKAYFPVSNPFTAWISQMGSRGMMWHDFIKTLISGYRLESDLNGQAKVFTPEAILRAHEEILGLTVLTPEDRRLMTTLRVSKRFEPLSLNNKIMKYWLNDESKWAFSSTWNVYDLPVWAMNDEKLGYDFDIANYGNEVVPPSFRPKRFGYLELGRIYYTSRSNWTRGRSMIPYNNELDTELDSRVTKTVREGIRQTKAFHKFAEGYIKGVGMRPAVERPRADININQSVTTLLNENLIPTFDAKLRDFRQATQDCFLSKCEDFK